MTGVQTCALPICTIYLVTRMPRGSSLSKESFEWRATFNISRFYRGKSSFSGWLQTHQGWELEQHYFKAKIFYPHIWTYILLSYIIMYLLGLFMGLRSKISTIFQAYRQRCFPVNWKFTCAVALAQACHLSLISGCTYNVIPRICGCVFFGLIA